MATYVYETIPLRAQRVNSFLGVTVESNEIEQRMRTLGAKVKRGRGGTWQVAPPSYRADLQLEADLIEEVARLRGYETIPGVLPRAEIHEKNRDTDPTDHSGHRSNPPAIAWCNSMESS